MEITGIPNTVAQKDLQQAVIKVYEEAKIKVEGDDLCVKDISACHRIGKTIVRFMNRKFAYEGMRSGKNLKGTKLYGDNNKIFINNSFCKEFNKYGYLIRKLKADGDIAGYKVKQGISQIQLEKDDQFIEISHFSDFGKLSLDVSLY